MDETLKCDWFYISNVSKIFLIKFLISIKINFCLLVSFLVRNLINVYNNKFLLSKSYALDFFIGLEQKNIYAGNRKFGSYKFQNTEIFEVQ